VPVFGVVVEDEVDVEVVEDFSRAIFKVFDVSEEFKVKV
jgi:ribosome maturation factor RimP